MTRRALALAAAVAATVLALALPAQAQKSDWQTLLNNRLMTEKNCEVVFYTGVVERTIDDKETVIAKAHCKDKRAFDVARSSQFELFTIKECQPQPTTC
jgi:hypothetical protein